jgi:DNA-directed RNA polymerase specialized sigma24 family protein
MRQPDSTPRVFYYMEPDEPGAAGALRLPEAARPRAEAGEGAEAAVGALYQASALGLIRLAYVMLGDRPSAEDVVPEASAEAVALSGEEREEVVRAVGRLPHRQREALVLALRETS